MNKIVFSFAVCFFAVLLQAQTYRVAGNDNLLQDLNQSLTEAIVFDGFSPPVASRIYAYCNIAAYEALRWEDEKNYPTLSGRLNALKLSSKPTAGGKYDYNAAMVEAFSKVAKELVYRSFIIDSIYTKCEMKLAKYDRSDVLENSKMLGQKLADEILVWAATDGYKKTRDMPRYTTKENDSSWAATPPTYSSAVEPYWGTIRAFVLDSGGQYQCPGPPKFGKTKGTELYEAAKEVMEYGARADSMQQVVCLYWDCNPLRTYVKAHLMYNARQLTPGGHWMAIAKYASNKKGLDQLACAKVYMLISIAVADGFIIAWHEKFRTDFIRPETYINRYIDPSWKPMLETPSFPEYPSAHSVVSAAASDILTKLFGDNFSFADSSEMDFHMNIRYYNSFQQAADEAALSRLYGGIHYLKACEDGKMLGREVGDLVIKKLGIQ